MTENVEPEDAWRQRDNNLLSGPYAMNSTQHGAHLNQAWRQATLTNMPDMDALYFQDGTAWDHVTPWQTHRPVPPQRSHAELSAQAKAQPRNRDGTFAEIPHGLKPSEMEAAKTRMERGLKRKDAPWPHGIGGGSARRTKDGRTIKRPRLKTQAKKAAQTATKAKRPRLLLPGMGKKKRKIPWHKRGVLGKVVGLFNGDFARMRRREARKNSAVPLDRKPRRRRR